MPTEILKDYIAPSITMLAASIAAVSAYFSHNLSKRIHNEIKSDETIITGPAHLVGLRDHDHDKCVLRVSLFNKSARKAFITDVSALNEKGEDISIKWSNSMDGLGNIQNSTGLLGLVNSENLCVRRMDGEAFDMATILITHSFSKGTLIVKYDPFLDWD